ncbi:hypothetical protein L2703_05180 [Shewanella basaltis]|uniref:glycosyltransferase family 2 protein n=1 Tax=Shewanella basaltis TaxID=472183 RepID=UPI00200CA210|nr:hypothetical protein [Shewanella basaltis]MCL1112989.1 hypothetical protein [Shewanella basaltis]
MYKISVLILIYNKKVEDSESFKGILKSKINLTDFNVVVWNNGPEVINYESFPIPVANFELVQTISNESLSKIYNIFISRFKSERYVILDDDSLINDIYLEEIKSVSTNLISLPIVSCNGMVTSPLSGRKPIEKKITNKNKKPLFAIGSGMVIGHDAALLIKRKYGNVFDERFYFYGVDVSLCHRVNSLLDYISYNIISGFEHNQSKFQYENKNILDFRKKERSYDLGLRLRFYTPPLKSFLVIFRVLVKIVFNYFSNQNNRYFAKDLITAFFTGKHYKN